MKPGQMLTSLCVLLAVAGSMEWHERRRASAPEGDDVLFSPPPAALPRSPLQARMFSHSSLWRPPAASASSSQKASVSARALVQEIEGLLDGQVPPEHMLATYQDSEEREVERVVQGALAETAPGGWGPRPRLRNGLRWGRSFEPLRAPTGRR